MFCKRVILYLLLLFVTTTPALSQNQKNNLFAGVTPYLQSLHGESIAKIISNVEALISSTDDPKKQSQIAGIAFDFYTSSPVMGEEAVAVYIADNYFLNKKLEWSNESTYPLLFTWTEFNRASLIGNSAPELFLEDIFGNKQSLRNCEGEYKILYFYDDECATCREESKQLIELLNSYSGAPISFFAIYTQSSKERWERYVDLNFKTINNPIVTQYHLWDPEGVSLYHKLYGVLSTPTMLLIDGQNFIVGRKLNSEALSQILQIENQEKADYKALFDNIFTELGPVDSSAVMEIAQSFYRRTASDSALYRETFAELFDYLKVSSEYDHQKGGVALAKEYIIGNEDYWSKEYLIKVDYAIEAFSKNMLGERATELILQNKRGRNRSIFPCLKRPTILFFHLIDCSECQKEKELLDQWTKEYKKRGIRVVCIYVGDNKEKWKKFVEESGKKWLYLWDENGASQMREKYDLLYVPKIYLLDKNRKVIAKDIDVNTLNQIIQQL